MLIPNISVFNCPFCKSGEGLIQFDPYAARRLINTKNGAYFHADSGEGVMLFGSDNDPLRKPCEHILYLHATMMDWRLNSDDTLPSELLPFVQIHYNHSEFESELDWFEECTMDGKNPYFQPKSPYHNLRVENSYKVLDGNQPSNVDICLSVDLVLTADPGDFLREANFVYDLDEHAKKRRNQAQRQARKYASGH